MRFDRFIALWVLLTAIWALASRRSKRTIRREGAAGRIIHWILYMAGCLLLFIPWRLAPLGARFVPEASAIVLGGYLAAAGLAFATWARFVLGRDWSMAVTVKEDHKLIRRGPYRIVRHPIYTGILLMLVGTAIGYGRVSGLIGVALALAGFWVKWRTEERFMVEQFGVEYVQYQREVKAIIPGLI
jgi:protein-S-isoprenylcysteine O-methyltransferase Ste14